MYGLENNFSHLTVPTQTNKQNPHAIQFSSNSVPYYNNSIAFTSHSHRASIESVGTPEFDYRTDSSLSPVSYDLATPPYVSAGDSSSLSNIYELPPLNNKRPAYLDFNASGQYFNVQQPQPRLAMNSTLLPIQRSNYDNPLPSYNLPIQDPLPARQQLLNYSAAPPPAFEPRRFDYTPSVLPYSLQNSYQPYPPAVPALAYNPPYNLPYYPEPVYENYPSLERFAGPGNSQAGPSAGQLPPVDILPARNSSKVTPTPKKKPALNANGKPIRKVSTQTFPCPHPHCESVFSRNFNMQSHLKAHKGIRDFDCFHCIKKFSRRHDRARHISAVHGISLEAQAASLNNT